MKQLNSEKSFTLTELLIVVSIIGILTAVSFPYYQSASRQLALQRAASKLAQDIRRVQEMAMSAQEFSDCLGTEGYKYGCGVLFKVAAWPTKYQLFADCDGDGVYDGDTVDIAIEDVDLEKGIEIESTPGPGYFIIFTPPDPTVDFKNLNPAIITITNGEQSKTIKVNEVGLITIE